MKFLSKPNLTIACLLLLLLVVQGIAVSCLGSRNTDNESLKAQLIPEKLPQHIAILMDGNGRWAKKQNQPRIFGHQHATQSVREAIEGCIELGIPYLTLYAFSTENWDRPQEEVDALMQLFTNTCSAELEDLVKQGVKFKVIGELQRLPLSCQEALQEVVAATQHNERLYLTVALSYSGRRDIVAATRAIAKDVSANRIKPNDISIGLFKDYLSTKDIPDPDLIIRTGGEMRISNFLLWEIAYAELYFTPIFWPDFRKDHLYGSIVAYQQRERRFGKIN